MSVRPEQVAARLVEVFPELGAIDDIVVLNDGPSALVVESPQGVVFKIAKSWDSGAGFAKEQQLLPAIRDRLPAAIPYPVWAAGASKHFPFGVIGYPKLAGTPLSVEDGRAGCLTRDVGRFMQALHSIDVTPEIANWVPRPHAYWEQLERPRLTYTPSLREQLTPEEFRSVNHWWDDLLTDERMLDCRPVLHHGDFWHGNMLVNGDSCLTAVVDWEHAAAGDPAQDVATLLHLGREFTLAVLQVYEAAGGILDEGLLYRAQRLWELREFHGLGLAAVSMNQKAFDDAVSKLRNGPLLNDQTRKETQLWPPPQR